MSSKIYRTSNGLLTLRPPTLRGLRAEFDVAPTPLAAPDPDGYTHLLGTIAFEDNGSAWAGSTLLRPEDATEIARALAGVN